MAKIVLTYSTLDDPECHCDYHDCFEYESTEAFLVNFEKVLLEAMVKQKAGHAELTAWQDKMPKDPRQEELYYAWRATRPDFTWEDVDEFQFAGKGFYVSDFVSRDDNRIVMPKIQTLDEWFESKKIFQP